MSHSLLPTCTNPQTIPHHPLPPLHRTHPHKHDYSPRHNSFNHPSSMVSRSPLDSLIRPSPHLPPNINLPPQNHPTSVRPLTPPKRLGSAYSSTTNATKEALGPCCCGKRYRAGDSRQEERVISQMGLRVLEIISADIEFIYLVTHHGSH